MIRWLAPRAEPSREVASDADALSALGDHAYDVARHRARIAWKAHLHWDAVRRELGRRSGRSFLDVATRMLARPRGQQADDV